MQPNTPKTILNNFDKKVPWSEKKYRLLFRRVGEISIPFLFIAMLSGSLFYLPFSFFLIAALILEPRTVDAFTFFVFSFHIANLIFLLLLLLKQKSQTWFAIGVAFSFAASYFFIFFDMVRESRAYLVSLATFLYIVLALLTTLVIRLRIIQKQSIKKWAVVFTAFLLIAYLLQQVGDRVVIGEYINSLTNYAFNIFYLDAGGYFIINTNLIVIVLTLSFFGFAKWKKAI